MKLYRLLLLAGLLCLPLSGNADDELSDDEFFNFEDAPLRRDVEYPPWFKLSFLDLPEDLAEAIDNGKRGLMVYYGQKHCAYCKKLMETDFAMDDIVNYTRKNFDVVPIDIWSDRDVTDLAGNVLTEKQLAEREKTNFTPSLAFYGPSGKEVFRLRGYYPPYQFRAALEFVADKHYEEGSFRDYLERGDVGLAFSDAEMIEDELFSAPPYLLERRYFPADKPLAVFFEQGNCHACEILHGEEMQNSNIRELLSRLDNVQLNVWSDTPVLTPDGQKLTARQWATQLGVFYTPTIVFFDERGAEIFRIDSVVRLHRLAGVLSFISSGDYKLQPYYQRWTESRPPVLQQQD